MAERLPVIVKQPDTLIDWWAQAGAGADALAAAYPRAQRWAVDPEPFGASPRRRWWRPAPPPPMRPQDVPVGRAQLLWANMMLHWVDDTQAEMQRWHALIQEGGFLMFSTLGPGTLDALRTLYADAGWPVPHADFVDMHDLGDMLVHAGFADPVMDQETLTLHWADPEALLRELRTLGGNVDHRRFAGLRTPRWLADLQQRLAVLSPARPALRFEVVYGHAFRPPDRIRVAAQTEVGLETMRSILRSGRES